MDDPPSLDATIHHRGGETPLPAHLYFRHQDQQATPAVPTLSEEEVDLFSPRESVYMDQSDDGCVLRGKRRLWIWVCGWGGGSFRYMAVNFRFYLYHTKESVILLRVECANPYQWLFRLKVEGGERDKRKGCVCLAEDEN